MKIICFGDSNTFGYDPRGYFGDRYDHPWPEIVAGKLNCTVLNWGQNGREIPGRVIDFPADMDLLIVMLGTNDLLQGASPETVSKKMEQFLEAIPSKKILLIAPPPMKPGTWVPSQNLIDHARNLTNQYMCLAKQRNIRFADAEKWDVSLAYDGVHLTQEGHSAFAKGLIDYLNKGEN